MSIYETITTVILVLTVFVGLYHAHIATTNQQINNDRIKKQSTIEYYQSIRAIFTPTLLRIKNMYNYKIIDENDYKTITSDINSEADIREILGYLEHLSVGVKADIFDLYILESMSGSFLIRFYNQWEFYITQKRYVNKNPELYKRYEELVLGIKYIRQQKNNAKTLKDTGIVY